MKDKAIIFFTRIPTLGKTKTRLEPFLGKEQCVELQTAFIKDIYNNIKNMGIDIIVCYSDDGELGALKEVIDEDVYYLKQDGRDLGEKMYNSLSYALKKYEKAMVIGSDIPLISCSNIEEGFEILEKKDIVISPTYDGGYYLIGMKEEHKEVFKIKYSTSSVFVETVDKIKSIGKSFNSGKTLLDIDDKGDFLKLYTILSEDESIPCHNTRNFVEAFMGKCDHYDYSVG